MEEQQIKDYWNLRAEGFSLSNQEKIQSNEADKWIGILNQYIPEAGKIECLDIGTGPGLLGILLAKMGHKVTAIDYTDNMLEHARENASKENVNIDFQKMDAQELSFEENRFDLIVSRNLTWNLEFPRQAYLEWLRVLKPEGRLLNFDGNHYLHCYDNSYKQYRNSKSYVDPHKKEHLKDVDITVMEDIAKNLPLSKVERPAWDVQFLLEEGVKLVTAEVDRPSFIDSEGVQQSVIDTFYICAKKNS